MMRMEQGFVLPIVLILSLLIGFWVADLLTQSHHNMLASTYHHTRHKTTMALQSSLLTAIKNQHDHHSLLPTLADWLQHHQPTHDKQRLLMTTCRLSSVNLSSLAWQDGTQSRLNLCRNPAQNQHFWLTVTPISQTQYAYDFADVAGHHLSIYAVQVGRGAVFEPSCLQASMVDLSALRCLNDKGVTYRTMAAELLLTQNGSMSNAMPSSPSWRFLRIYDVYLTDQQN